MVKSMRDAEEISVELTNYRLDGTSFRNSVTLMPVRDVNGLYCYSVAVMADVAAMTESSTIELDRLRELLPRKCNVDRARTVPPLDFVQVSDAVRKQRGLDKLVCLTDTDRCLSALLEDPEGLETFREHVSTSRTAPAQLAMVMAVRELSMKPAAVRAERAAQVAREHMPAADWDLDDSEEVQRQLIAAASAAMHSIAEDHIATFVASSSSDAAVKRLQLGGETSVAGLAHLLWDGYHAPPESAGWLFGVIGIVDMMPECFTLTDVRLPGNPLIYVNQAFCKTVGYSKSEVLGCNCRFLQGPETEVGAVAVVNGAIRRGESCCVRITNYKRNGETFKNFLIMNAIVDAGGTTRFFAGVQKDLTDNPRDSVTTTILSELIPPLYADPSGGTAAPQARGGAANLPKAEAAAQSAIIGMLPSGGAEDIRGSARFSREHARMLEADHGMRDWVNLSAILWLCAETSAELAAEFAKQLIACGGVDPFRRVLVQKVATITTDTALQAAFDEHLAPDEQAERLAPVISKHIGLFLEAPEGVSFLEKLHGCALEAFDEDAQLRKNNTWLEMLEQAIEKLPFAVVLVDMQEPATRIVLVNDAFEKLTGREKDYAIGRNCRFLQGELTEAEELTILVQAIRQAKPVQVELTNYKEDGTSFRNYVSMRSIHDSNGTYRFCISVQTDVLELLPLVRERVERLVCLLPSRFEALNLPVKEPPKGEPDMTNMPNLSKLYWLHNLEASLRAVLDDPDAFDSFKEHVGAAEASLTKLDMVVAVRELRSQPFEAQEDAAHEVASTYLDPGTWENAETEELLEQLVEASAEAIRAVATEHMPSFVLSEASDDAVERLESGAERAFGSSTHLLWEQYKVPPEAAGWLYAVISAVETLPECFTISDCRVPGNPLIYVNQAFCKTVGYSKAEVLGRNCRFLQGPETELDSLVEIMSAFRRSGDCSVTLTNYKRSGATFRNELRMRAVVDGEETARFFIGVQFDDSSTGTNRMLSSERAAAVLELIPVTLDYLEPLDEDAVPPPPDEELAPDYFSAIRFVREHTLMLKAVGAFDPSNPFTRLLWYGDRAETLKALIPCQIFTTCFQEFLAECFPLSLSGWELSCAIASLSTIALKQRDEHMRTIYEKLTGESPAGKSALLLRQALDREGAKLTERILSDVFPAFLGHPLCTTMLQIMTKEEESGGTRPTGLEFVEVASWIEMFEQAVEKLPQAIIVADMHNPGAKIVSVNPAFTQFTGYEREAVVGRNCRFMQGEATEPESVLKVIDSLRKCKTSQVELTNYKQDGTMFRNLLSLHPVHDSLGLYRFSIGILADAGEMLNTQRAELELLRKLLPAHFEEELQPIKRAEPTTNAQANGKRAPALRKATELDLYKKSMLEDFGQLAWLRDPEGSVSLLARDENALSSLRETLPSQAAKQSLDLWLEACEVEILFDDDSREELSQQILAKFFGNYEVSEGKTLPEELQRESELAYANLLQVHFPNYLKAADDKARSMLLKLDSEIQELIDTSRDECTTRLWLKYRPQADVEDWLCALTAVSEQMPFSLCITDTMMPANPIVYVNEKFTELTGYSKGESQGRNCRFLQGPETETESINEIKSSVQNAELCAVQITNYRKSGESFSNLLVMRPVKDSNGLLRYCIGMQLELDGSLECEKMMRLLATLMDVMPSVIDLTDPAEREKKRKAAKFAASMPMGRNFKDMGDISGIISSIKTPGKPNAAPAEAAKTEPAAGEANGAKGEAASDGKAESSAEAAPQQPTPAQLIRAAFYKRPAQTCRAAHDVRAAESLVVRDMTRLQWLSASPQTLAEMLGEDIIKQAFQSFVNARSSEAAAVLENVLEQLGDGASEEVLDMLTPMREHFWSQFLDTQGATRAIYKLQEENSELISRTTGSWLDKLKAATENLSTAIVVADMHAPGARLVAANAAFEDLTGHSLEWAVGRNCRFLQGDRSERAAVQTMVDCLRTGQPTQVELTNYKQGGTPFRNLVSLQPVHDSNGVYRYCIGMLSDVGELSEAMGAEIGMMRRLMPIRFDVRQQPIKAPHRGGTHPPLPPNMSLLFSRLALLQDLRGSTTLILEDSAAAEGLTQHLTASPEGTVQLDLYMRVKKFLTLPPNAQRERVFKEFPELELGGNGSRKGAAMAKEAIAEVTQLGEQALQSVSVHVPSFICSQLIDDISVKRLLNDDGSVSAGRDIGAQKLLWEGFQVPPDAASWLYALVKCVDENAVYFTISDLRAAGNPLIYANKAFFSGVGYDRAEVLGRNCRFLQGRDTKAQSVSQIVHGIRSGSGCSVRVMNYKRDGSPFENSLTLRTIADSDGIARFCIGLQYNARPSGLDQGAEGEVSALSQLEAMVDAIGQLVPGRFSAVARLEALEEQEGMALSGKSAADQIPAAAPVSAAVPPPVSRAKSSLREAPSPWHENDAYTKVMWLRNCQPEFVRGLLNQQATGPYWERFMKAKERPALYSLRFCLAMSNHATLEGNERRQSAFAIAAAYLKETDATDPEQLEEQLAEENDTVTKRLVQSEFAPFVASTLCTELIHELRTGKAKILTCFLFPDKSRLPKNISKEESCFECLKIAISGYNLPVMLCDRGIPGLPIVGMSEGVTKLTGYDPADLIGQSCRILQGPKTELDAVTSMSAALRKGSACRVTLTNYTKLGSPFANLLSLGGALRLTPNGQKELNAAVLHEKPRPMNEERVELLGEHLLSVLDSCGCPKAVEPLNTFPGGVTKAELEVGSRWVMDAIQTMKKTLRIDLLRELFLKSALLSANQQKEVTEEEGGGIQNVHLMLHSKNTLRDYTQYMSAACSFWGELENMKNNAGWEYRNSLMSLNKKFIVPERGRQKRAWLWVVLRQSVFDRMAENELQLVEAEDIDFGIDIDMELEEGNIAPPEPTPADDGNKGDAETGSASTAVANADVVLRDAAMLQHVLLRCFALEIIPMFIYSPEYTEVRAELLTAENRPPVYAVLDVELESLRETFPKTGEEWLGLALAAIKYLPHAVIVCDASLPGLPIVGVNVGFEALTGYKSSFAVGKNCSFMQGPETGVTAIQELREAIRAQESCHVSLLNYKSNGSTFLNFLSITPILDEEGLCHYYVGTLTEVLERFSGLKPQLRSADRLHKFLPARLRLKSRPDARARMQVVVKTPRPKGLTASDSSASLRSDSGKTVGGAK
jgi:PAS domain S-box-containing protein